MAKQKPLAEIRRTREPNVKCDLCGKMFFKHECHLKRTKSNFCSKACMDNFTGGNKLVKCGVCGKEVYRSQFKLQRNNNFYCSAECYQKTIKKTPTSAKTILTYRSYINWKKRLLDGAKCIFCGLSDKLELHHIKPRRDYPELVKREENVIPICENCHDIFHSNSSKGGELRETLNAILAHGNPQPSRSNVINLVDRKVQRLTGEEITADKPDTSAARESDDIVRAYLKG